LASTHVRLRRPLTIIPQPLAADHPGDAARISLAPSRGSPTGATTRSSSSSSIRSSFSHSSSSSTRGSPPPATPPRLPHRRRLPAACRIFGRTVGLIHGDHPGAVPRPLPGAAPQIFGPRRQYRRRDSYPPMLECPPRTKFSKSIEGKIAGPPGLSPPPNFISKI